MALDCAKFNHFLFRRVPDFDKELAKDRFPFNYLYTTMYETKPWPSFTGTTHTWDRVHVTRPNDDGCWEEMNANACLTDICDPARLYTGWGSTRANYVKYHRDYQSPVFCFDTLRHVEEAVAQLDAIVQGHKELPDQIVSDFLRMLSVRQSDQIWICGASDIVVPTTAAMFTNQCKRIDLGGAANLPTSKLTMNYLDNHIENLMYNGYFNKEFYPQGKFFITADIQTIRDNANANPALTQMYNAADFAKGGKFYAYGVMTAVGNWMFKIDKEPLRFQHVGNGVLERIWPYENHATTIGLRPEFSLAYKNAPYQMYHVYNRAARQVYVGDITSVNADMKFGLARNLMGKWSWKSPDYFRATDPNSGEVCEYNNDKKNKGYFLGEYELGIKTIYPEIEMVIIALREPQCVVDLPRCASDPEMVYQDLLPYNPACPNVDAGVEES